MAQYYSVKKAVETTGKSESTIKRLLTSVKNDPDSPDRQHLLPSVELYERHKKNGTPFQWEISETLLQQQYPEVFRTTAPEKGTAAPVEPESSAGDSRYIDHLEQQLSQLQETNIELRQQNSSLTTSLTSLTDRVTNMLGHYQVKALGPAGNSGQQLPTSGQNEQPKATVVNAQESPAAPGTGEGTTPHPSSASKKSTKPKTSRKKATPKKTSVFEKHTPTFHRAFSNLIHRKS